MRLDGTDLASADGATNRTSLLVLRSRPRLVPEKYFPAGFTLCRSDAGGHVRPRIRKTLLHEDASDGVESGANIYKRRSTSTLSIQNRSTVLHTSFEKTKTGVYINLRSQEQAMGTLHTRLQEMGAALYRRVGGKSSSRSQRPIPRGKRCPLATPHSQSRTRNSQSRTGNAGGADSRDGQVGIGSTESYKRKETQRFFQRTGRTMNHLEENQEDELSVFTPPLTNTGVNTRQWIEYRPTNQISGESPLEFLIPPQSIGCMDLRRSTLKIKLRLTTP
jgi:hypothetical protein